MGVDFIVIAESKLKIKTFFFGKFDFSWKIV